MGSGEDFHCGQISLGLSCTAMILSISLIVFILRINFFVAAF